MSATELLKFGGDPIKSNTRCLLEVGARDSDMLRGGGTPNAMVELSATETTGRLCGKLTHNDLFLANFSRRLRVAHAVQWNTIWELVCLFRIS